MSKNEIRQLVAANSRTIGGTISGDHLRDLRKIMARRFLSWRLVINRELVELIPRIKVSENGLHAG